MTYLWLGPSQIHNCCRLEQNQILMTKMNKLYKIEANLKTNTEYLDSYNIKNIQNEN